MSKIIEVYIKDGKEHINDKLSTAVLKIGYEYSMVPFEDFKETLNGEHPELIIANPNFRPIVNPYPKLPADFFSDITSILDDHEYQGKIRATNWKEGAVSWSDFTSDFYKAFKDYDHGFMEIINSEQVEDYLRRTLGLTD
tara:strand:+ start:599 stop:1018 length:420 start_codon:yes stop_codon:yes gene_type:complete